MLKAIADENDLSKTTLQHIKGVLSGIFTHARNEGAFDDANPIQGAVSPTTLGNRTRPLRTTWLRFVGFWNFCQRFRRQSLRPRPLPGSGGVNCADSNGPIIQATLNVKRTVWKTVVNQPKRRASAKPVPVIRQLAEILDTYRNSMGDPQSGVMFHTGAGEHLDIDKLVLRDVCPVGKNLDIDWYGLHGFRRGIASNLYELGADEKIVQRVLRQAKSYVTKDRYIKTFDPALVAAMKKLEATVDLVNQSAPRVHQIN
jgi:integrase